MYPSKVEWDLTNGNLSKLLGLLVSVQWRFLGMYGFECHFSPISDGVAMSLFDEILHHLAKNKVLSTDELV